MNVPVQIIIAVILVFGFLTGSTLYFYNSSRPERAQTSDGSSFDAELPGLDEEESNSAIEEFTEPAAHRGRVTFPANVYTIVGGDTLFGIGSRFGLRHQLIVLANGFENENIVQVGNQLVIPVLNPRTDYYRINFTINEDNASALNRQLRDESSSDWFDPIKVAQKNAIAYFGIAEGDEFSLVEQDLSRGTAVVSAKGPKTNHIGLYQPKQKGERGFWTILYIENHD